jgi:hypothetical protein
VTAPKAACALFSSCESAWLVARGLGLFAFIECFGLYACLGS